MNTTTKKIAYCIAAAVFYSIIVPSSTICKEHATPPERRAEATGYFISAKRFELKKDHRGAIVELLEAASWDPHSPMIPYAIARNYLYLGNAGRAVEYARKAVTLDPTFAEGRKFLITLFRHSGDFTGATSELERLIKEQPNDWETFFTLVTMHLDSREQEKAVKLLNSLKRREKLPPHAAIGAASLLLDMKRYKEAEVFYRMAITADSTVEEAWLGIGTTFEATGEKRHAISLYREALKKNPQSSDLYGRLASLYVSEGLLDEVLKSGTENPDFCYAIGMALVQSGRYDDATKVTGHLLLRSDQIDPERWNNAAYAYMMAGRYDDGLELIIRNAGKLRSEEATLSMVKYGLAHIQDRERITKLLADALSHAPQNDLLMDAHGTVLTGEERWIEAIPFFEKATAITPDNTEYLFDLGSALERSGRFDEAVTVFEKLLAIDPEHSYALNYLGYMFAEKGIHLQESVEMLKKAVDARPNNGAFLDSLGWAYYRLGILDKAEEYIDQAVQQIDTQDKENAVIFEHLGDVSKALGKIEKARIHWTKSLEIDPNNLTTQEKLKGLTIK